MPILLLNLLDFLLAQTEVVPDLVDQRFADCHDEVVLVFRLPFERPLEEQDAIRKSVAVVPRAFGQRRPLVEPEEGVSGLDVHFFQYLIRRLVLDHDGEVCHGLAEPARNGGQRVGHEPLEAIARHVRCFPARRAAAGRRPRAPADPPDTLPDARPAAAARW